MKKIQLSRLEAAVITLAIVVLFMASNIVSLYIGLAGNAAHESVTSEEIAAEEQEAKSNGETGNEIYTIETWEDGKVKIVTMQQYIQTPDKNTIVITDR